ncbi:MAG: DUF1648 domain-containing protein [Bacillota bacterium]
MNRHGFERRVFCALRLPGGGLVLLTWAVSLVYYPLLPGKTPVYFDPQGRPAGWVDTTPAGIFMTPLLQTILFLLLLGVCYLATHLADLGGPARWQYLNCEGVERIRSSLLPGTVSLILIGLLWLSHHHVMLLQIMSMQRNRLLSVETVLLSSLFWAAAAGAAGIHLFTVLRGRPR